MENLLYTIKSWRENEKKTGLILHASAKNEKGNWVSVRIYVPYVSKYPTSTTAKKSLFADGEAAEIVIPTQKFDES